MGLGTKKWKQVGVGPTYHHSQSPLGNLVFPMKLKTITLPWHLIFLWPQVRRCPQSEPSPILAGVSDTEKQLEKVLFLHKMQEKFRWSPGISLGAFWYPCPIVTMNSSPSLCIKRDVDPYLGHTWWLREECLVSREQWPASLPHSVTTKTCQS